MKIVFERKKSVFESGKSESVRSKADIDQKGTSILTKSGSNGRNNLSCVESTPKSDSNGLMNPMIDTQFSRSKTGVFKPISKEATIKGDIETGGNESKHEKEYYKSDLFVTKLVQKRDSCGSGQNLASNNQKGEASRIAELSKHYPDRSTNSVGFLEKMSKSDINSDSRVINNEVDDSKEVIDHRGSVKAVNSGQNKAAGHVTQGTTYLKSDIIHAIAIP